MIQMKVSKISVGTLQANCYLIKQDNKGLIVDPGDEIDKIINLVGDTKVLAVLITHHHFDHVGALSEFLNKYKCDVIDFGSTGHKTIGPFSFDIISTKGHTSDSVTYYFKNNNLMFTGDFLFKDNIGRCDLPTGSYSEMSKSIELIKSYDRNIIIYPGHAESTTLGYEFDNNSYLKGDNNE